MSMVRTLTAACACLFVISCATKPVPVTPPEPLTRVTITMKEVATRGLDIDSLRITAGVLVSNDGETDVTLAGLGWVTRSGPLVLSEQAHATDKSLKPGQSAVFDLESDIDAPAGDSPWIDLRLESTLSFRDTRGRPGTASASFDTRFPRIMPPVLEIRSIRILKDELINTKLGVDLSVHNPNVFPLSFASLEYRLYSEGQYWAGDTLAKKFEVPAGQSAEAGLYMTMNFTDMDRRLLDRVIRLAAVSYRLGGMALIDTGLDFLPRFELPFDLSGRTEVLR
jgi:hypothetical protein